MLKIEELKEQSVENVLVKEHMRAHLQESASCTCKRFTAAGNVQTVLKDEKSREEEQERHFSCVGVVSLSVNNE